MEHHTTTTGRQKFWRSNPLPEQPSWTPKRPILEDAPKPRRYSPPVRKTKTERNRQLCKLRAKGHSVKRLARDFVLHPVTVRRLLDQYMTPDEAEKDEQHTEFSYRREKPGEAERAAELRRSGMKFKDVARAIGRSLATTAKLLRKAMPPEEMAARASHGRGHQRGKFGVLRNPTSEKKRAYRRALASGERVVDSRPYRKVVSVTYVPSEIRSGGVNRMVLECGHVLDVEASRGLHERKRCSACKP